MKIRSLFKRSAPEPQNAAAVDGSLLFDNFGLPTSNHARVTEGNARSIEIVFSAVNLLVSSLSTLPMSLIDQSDGRRSVLSERWEHRVAHTEPCPGWTPSRWFGSFWLNAILFGNATAVIDRKRQRISIVPWHRVRIESEPDYSEPRYYVGDGGDWYPARDVIHVQAPSLCGDQGDSPVVKCAKALGVAKHSEAFAEGFYRRAIGMSGYIKSDKDIAWESEDRKKFIESFRSQFAGPQNAGKAGILPPGADYVGNKPMQREAQHIESALHQTRVVARMFNIPPHKLGDDAKTSYSSLEQEQRRYVIDALMPWMVRAEQEFALKTLAMSDRRRGMAFKINADALLRGDARTRTDVLVAEVAGGLRTINEARRLLDLDPVAGGDQILVAANNLAPLKAISENNTPPE